MNYDNDQVGGACLISSLQGCKGYNSGDDCSKKYLATNVFSLLSFLILLESLKGQKILNLVFILLEKVIKLVHQDLRHKLLQD